MKRLNIIFICIILSLSLCCCKENNNEGVSSNMPTTPSTQHTHVPTDNAQTVSEPISGYCGNTQTTIYFDNGKKYTFMYGESVTMTDILVNLDYDKNKLCKCLPEYTVDTEFGTGYGINITSGYARCDKGQADLTNKQIEKFKEIIKWAEDKSE